MDLIYQTNFAKFARVPRNKARLVAQGYCQKEGIGY